jgi:hypothetical protein
MYIRTFIESTQYDHLQECNSYAQNGHAGGKNAKITHIYIYVYIYVYICIYICIFY